MGPQRKRVGTDAGQTNMTKTPPPSPEKATISSKSFLDMNEWCPFGPVSSASPLRCGAIRKADGEERGVSGTWWDCPGGATVR